MSKIKLLNTKENGYFENNQIDIVDSIPTTGSYRVGDIMIKSTQVANEAIGWICIEAGTPGIWAEFGGMITDDRELIINPDSVGMNELSSEIKSKLNSFDSCNLLIKQIKEQNINTENQINNMQNQITNIQNQIEDGVGDVSSETIGELTQLKTDDKSNIVNSINEIYDMIAGQKDVLINNLNDLIDTL